LILYGPTPRIAELDSRDRPRGEAMHEDAVREHVQAVEGELARAGR
jgi:hypothetical protein